MQNFGYYLKNNNKTYQEESKLSEQPKLTK